MISNELILITIDMLLLIATIPFLILLIISLIETATIKISYIPIPAHAIQNITEEIVMNSNSVCYDLGCGDGRILTALYKRYNGTGTYIGIELATWPYILARKNTKKTHIQIKKQDIATTNLANATDIICYLCPELMADIEEKAKKECARKTKIISCDFKMPTLEPIKTISIKTDQSKRGQYLYVYEI
ncbi:MAG: hypothetical protein RIQ54_60 [Candidatus Parcubacteria bacterium]|jgi:predicted RNA methylase